MIFQKLTLTNFGQYKGFHEIEFGTAQDKPITLIGGHNGGGKTTILDAMQLCLYGKRSNCYGRSDQTWPKYLKAWINRDSDPTLETRIKISFIHPHQGKEKEFRVEFSWKTAGKKITERKEIFINNELDEHITQTWDKYIDSVLPARLSTLFFFDGEQIENLVRPETAQSFLESAITELLGIGTVDQLRRDLTTLNRNKTLSQKSQAETQKLRETESVYEETQKHVYHLEEQVASLHQKQAIDKKQLEVLESEYQSKGGKLLDDQSTNEKLKKELERQLEVLNKQIVKEQSGELPLHLIQAQLKEIKKQAATELEVKSSSQQLQQMQKLHGKYIREAKKHKASTDVINALEALTAKESERLENKVSNTPVYLELSQSSMNQVGATLANLPNAEKKYKGLQKQKAVMVSRINKIEAALDATPEKGALNKLLQQRRGLTKELTTMELEILTKEEALDTARSKAEQLKDRVVRLLGDSAHEKAQFEDDERIVFYSLKAQELLKEFRSKLLDKHLGKLELYIYESFQYLIKKQSLVHRLKIDPNTFGIELTNQEGKIIPAEKLSAGERQLLAIAIFWGLQKASSRPIPVMIDTPMGRLDSTHREHLVERYFPVAAHQVVLLSTDEEIVDNYYDALHKKTHKEWTITFDEDKSTTRIKKGYFQ